MAPETVDRIFEPFFTTKAVGKGTGLGLSVVHGIIQSHQGAITVYSQPGEGSVFHIYIPAVTEKSEWLAEQRPVELPRGKGQTILFVDDEIQLVSIGKRILEQLGYLVTAHTNPTQALNEFLDNPEYFDLVITDFSMPTMNGMKLAEECLRHRPDLPIILTSGHLESTKVEAFKSSNAQRMVLFKPNSSKSLSEAVCRILNHAGNN